MEALITASPEFFKGKKRAEVHAYFERALEFITQKQSKETIISAVVHMDEKTPHMHLSFVPLTEISTMLDRFIPAIEKMDTEMKKYRKVISAAATENAKLKKENEKLAVEAKGSTIEKLKGMKLQDDYAQAKALLERIPPEVLEQFKPHRTRTEVTVFDER